MAPIFTFERVTGAAARQIEELLCKYFGYLWRWRRCFPSRIIRKRRTDLRYCKAVRLHVTKALQRNETKTE